MPLPLLKDLASLAVETQILSPMTKRFLVRRIDGGELPVRMQMLDDRATAEDPFSSRHRRVAKLIVYVLMVVQLAEDCPCFIDGS